jgi:hypothetical protein
VEVVEGDFPTGVVGPAGGEEYRHEVGMRCRECGAVEEL